MQSPTVLNGAEVSIEPVAHIAPDGSPTADQRYRRDLPDETLCWIYEMMVVTRGVDTELVNLQRQGELALYPSCRGQEAAQIGAVGALRKTDWLFPQYRELGAFLLRNIAPSNVAAAWRGTWHGGLEFTDKHCAPMSVPIGTQVLHAVGSAMASAKLGDDNVSVGFLGDGATSTGDVHEAMNFASVFRAPCIFYVQNNQWAISVPVSKQLAAPSIAHRAIGYGMPGVRVDGNDPLACYAVMAFAAERARAGEGPTLIEAVTYRLVRTPRPMIPSVIEARTRLRSGRHLIRFRVTATTCDTWVFGRTNLKTGLMHEPRDFELSCGTTLLHDLMHH